MMVLPTAPCTVSDSPDPAVNRSPALYLPVVLIILILGLQPAIAVDGLYEMAESDPQQAVDQAADKAREAELAGDTRRLAELEFFRGKTLLDMERAALAGQAYERAAAAYEAVGDREGLMRARQGIGFALSDQEEYEQALEALYDTLRIAGELGEQAVIAQTQSRIGTVHFFSGDLESAASYFSRSRKGFEALDDHDGYAQAINNLAVIARHEGKLELARSLNEESLAIRRAIGDIPGMAASYNNLAVVAWLEGDLPETERQHKLSLELYRQAGDTLGEARSLHNLGYTYLLMEDFVRAEAYLADSLILIEEIDSNTLRLGHFRRMADLGVARSDYEAAFDARTRQLEITEVMQGESRQRQIAELRAVFEAERREQEIDLLQQERQSERLIRNTLMASAVALVLFIFLLWNRFIIESRANRLIAARNDELDAMDRIVSTLNTEEDLSHLLSTILEEALGFFEGADRGAFVARSRRDGIFRPAVWKGYRFNGLRDVALTEEQARTRYLDQAEMMTDGVYLRRYPGAITGYETLHQEDPSQAMLAIAIAISGETEGYLILQSKTMADAFTMADRENYRRFREHAISAFRRARHLEQLEQEKERAEQAHTEMARLARTDSLTGLPNRRYMQEQLLYEQARSERSGRAASVIICDIDNFKVINDQLSHDAGDQVLKHLSGLLGQRLRAQDSVARWGGEEFLLLLPETELDGARFLAEELRILIRETPLNYEGEIITTSITAGVARHRPGEESMEEAIRRADKALYRGKEGGRNRVEVAEGGDKQSI